VEEPSIIYPLRISCAFRIIGKHQFIPKGGYNMFELKNGILIKDGKPVFALGQSYYPSYHVQKVPVPPEGDRIGELKVDIKEMADAGFNIVRMAALGEVKRENGEVKVDFPLVDAIIQRAEEVDIATMVRLQGYSFNLSGYKDVTMLNQDNEEMPFHWGWFVRNCLNHPGSLKDNEDATVVSAAYFKKYPSVVSFQIYNEPAYPTKGYYDYNPHSIIAWRKWLVEQRIKTAEEAENIEPPRRRPKYDEDPSDWINWRLFHYQRMNSYLNNLSNKAKEGYSLPETLTCHMSCPAGYGSITRGEDYFEVAKGMDIMGITHYTPARGPQHYIASEVLDMTESAAAVFGKHAWLIEYNAHTKLSANEWERETYSAIGSGFKCIMYYQWRADYPYSDGPEPEGFGMVFNNRTKTEKYDRAIAMNKLINRIGGLFACAEKLRSGVAVLYSKNVNAWHDAKENGSAMSTGECHERSAEYMRAIYREFRKQGVAVDFVRTDELEENPLQVKILLIPSNEGLSEEERLAIDNYQDNGGIAAYYDPGTFGYKIKLSDGNTVLVDANTVLRKGKVTPIFECSEKELDVKVLKGKFDGKDYYTACLINIDSEEVPVAAGASLYLSLEGVGEGWQANFVTPKENNKLVISKDENKAYVELPQITTGGFLFISKEVLI
jgi:hypothetical protein